MEKQKHLAFIGRWCPLHLGHKKLMLKKQREKQLPLLIMIRDTLETPSTEQRKKIIDTWLLTENIPGQSMIIPDIEGVYWGRGVGYNLEEIQPEEGDEKYSGTSLRDALENEDYEEARRHVELTDEEETEVRERLKKLGYL